MKKPMISFTADYNASWTNAEKRMWPFSLEILMRRLEWTTTDVKTLWKPTVLERWTRMKKDLLTHVKRTTLSSGAAFAFSHTKWYTRSHGCHPITWQRTRYITFARERDSWGHLKMWEWRDGQTWHPTTTYWVPDWTQVEEKLDGGSNKQTNV